MRSAPRVATSLPQSLWKDGLIPAAPWRQPAAGPSDTAIKSMFLQIACTCGLSYSDQQSRQPRSTKWTYCLLKHREMVGDDAAVWTQKRTTGSCQCRKDSVRSTLPHSSRHLSITNYPVPRSLSGMVLYLLSSMRNVQCTGACESLDFIHSTQLIAWIQCLFLKRQSYGFEYFKGLTPFTLDTVGCHWD